jgi:protein arginine N-methyltransferase 1
MYPDERRILDQHRALLGDRVRTDAFAAAIARAVRPGDVVIDLGTGSGVLAVLASRAGARKVYAIEQGHMADVAAIIVAQNGCADRVEVLHARSQEVELPERANVLVTETLGNLGFDEQILPSVLDARARLLAPGARVIPSRVALVAAPVDAARAHEREVAFWSAPRSGVDVSPARTFAANQVRTVDVDEEALLAPGAPLIEVDLASAASPAISGAARFTVTRAGTMHGFAAWFVATLVDDLRVSNAPPLRTPNWRQAFLPLDEAVAVPAGAPIALQVESADGVNWRWRGSIGARAFDQTTLFGFAPCTDNVAPEPPNA